MWTRALLKQNAKDVLSQTYWRVLLVCAVGLLLTGELDVSFGQTVSDPASGLSIEASGLLFGSLLGLLVSLGVLIGFLLLVLLAAGWGIFFCAVLDVGWKRYMIRNRGGSPGFTTLFSAFDSHYWNVVSGQFYVTLRVFLFSLLLVIPGIVKGYEYSLVPYLLAENPELPPRRAAELSSLATSGEKWKLFLLDLSFIGWRLLGTLLFGVGIVFVEPYYQATWAELYAALRAKAIAAGYTSEAELQGL